MSNLPVQYQVGSCRAGLRILIFALFTFALLAGCRRGPSPEDAVTVPAAPTPTPTGASTPEAATTSPDLAPSLTPNQAPETASSPTSIPSPEPAQTQAALDSTEANGTLAPSLPNTLVKSWDPVSNVLYEFGQMTISADQLQWESGQNSPYTLISDEGGYLLKLESNPSFFDTPHPYIKLMPQIDASGAITDMEVAFYENEAAAKQNEYIMFGSYF